MFVVTTLYLLSLYTTRKGRFITNAQSRKFAKKANYEQRPTLLRN